MEPSSTRALCELQALHRIDCDLQHALGFLHVTIANSMDLAFADVDETKTGGFSNLCDWFVVSLFPIESLWDNAARLMLHSACAIEILRLYWCVQNEHSDDETFVLSVVALCT